MEAEPETVVRLDAEFLGGAEDPEGLDDFFRWIPRCSSLGYH